MPESTGARFGDLRDIKHVMILMQENRSFDHYFGSLSGVRGFGDRAAIELPGGPPVWRQPAAAPAADPDGAQYPWPLSGGTFEGRQPPTPEAGAQNYGGTDHSWPTQHDAWHGGLMDGWQRAKGGPTTMGFLTRPTCRSTTPWPTRTRSGTPTTALCWRRPVRTGPTCGPARSTPTRSTAPSSPTPPPITWATSCPGSATR